MQIEIILLLILMTSMPQHAQNKNVQLSPSLALVCPGQQLSLKCHANQSHVLQWIINLPNGNGIYMRSVPTIGDIPQLPIKVANESITVEFSRQSANPLISNLSIDGTVTGLNGTKINCSTGNSSAVAMIYVAHTDVFPASIEVLSETYFGPTNVNLTLKWIRDQEIIVSYDVNVYPHAASLLFISNSSVQLMLLYNTPYNVSVIASRCGQTTNTTIELLYDANECAHPLQQSSEFVIVQALRFPVLVDTTVNFSCPPDLMLSGPNSAVCTFSGQWEPDPRIVKCIHLKESNVTTLPPSSYVILVAVSASSIFIFIISALFLITSFCCLCQKHKQTINHISNSDVGVRHSIAPGSVIYDTVHATPSINYQIQDLELKHNMAYDSLKLRHHE